MNGKRTILFALISIIVLFVSSSFGPLSFSQSKKENGQLSMIPWVSIYSDYQSSAPIDLVKDCGLNDTSITQFKNCSFKVYITSPQSTSVGMDGYFLNGSNITVQTFTSNEAFGIENVRIGRQYSISFHMIDSLFPSDGPLQNYNIIGVHNYFNFTFRILPNLIFQFGIDSDLKNSTITPGNSSGDHFQEIIWLTHRHRTDETGEHVAGHRYLMDFTVKK